MTYKKLIQKLALANGLLVSMYDHTRIYFGDYYHVKISVVCTFAENACALEMYHQGEIELTGISYTRILEKMGVPAADVEQIIEILLNDFHRNALPYISSKDFPIKLIQNARAPKKSSLRKYTGAGY